MREKIEFGLFIRDARKKLGLSLAEVSEGVCSVSYLSLIEANKRTVTPQIAAKLAFRLGINLDEFGFSQPVDMNLVKAEASLYAGQMAEAKKFLDDAPDSVDRQILYARIESYEGSLKKAVETLSSAIENPGISKESKLSASVSLCRCLRDSGEIAASIQLGEKTLNENQAGVDHNLILLLRLTLAGAYTETGNIFRAKQLTEIDSKNFLNTSQLAMSYWSRSMVLQAAGDSLEAGVLAQKSLNLFRELDQPLVIAKLEYTSAWLDIQSSELPGLETQDKLNHAELFLRNNNLKDDLAMCLSTRGELESRYGNADATKRYFSESLALLNGSSGIKGRVLAAGASAYFSLGMLKESKEWLLQARKSLEDSGADRSAAGVWRQMAELYEEFGDTESVVACLKAATDLVGLAATPIQRTVRTVRS